MCESKTKRSESQRSQDAERKTEVLVLTCTGRWLALMLMATSMVIGSGAQEVSLFSAE